MRLEEVSCKIKKLEELIIKLRKESPKDSYTDGVIDGILIAIKCLES